MMHRWIAGVALMSACTPIAVKSVPATSREDIYILRSIREHAQLTADECSAAVTGFEPLATDAARLFSFWSIDASAAEGRVVDAKVKRVATLHACMGPTEERARQRFHARIELGGMSFQGTGECKALMLDTPETRMFPVRCHLVLSGLPPPYVGGLLTTNTLTSAAAFGGETDPPGYTQASIAIIRLWRKHP
jgi:hypothetical protein